MGVEVLHLLFLTSLLNVPEQLQAPPPLSYASVCVGRIILSGLFRLKITFCTLQGIEPEFVGCTALCLITIPTEISRRLVYLMWNERRSPILDDVGVKSAQPFLYNFVPFVCFRIVYYCCFFLCLLLLAFYFCVFVSSTPDFRRTSSKICCLGLSVQNRRVVDLNTGRRRK
jgi:hypothetical protein